MRYLVLGLLLLLTTIGASCRSSVENDASSELFVYNDFTDALLSDGSTRGSITLDASANDTRQLRVMRRVTDNDSGTTTVDVTATADYNSAEPTIATVGQNGTANAGLITALSAGTTQVEIIFRDDDNDPTDDDHAFLDVVVVP